MSVSVINISANPFELQFTSAQRYDFVISKDDETIWRWSRGRVFASVTGRIILKPGEERTYQASWRPKKPELGIHGLEGIIASRTPLEDACTFSIG